MGEAVLTQVREMVLPQIERHGPIEAWIIDDTGFPRKGIHSVGVARELATEGSEATASVGPIPLRPRTRFRASLENRSDAGTSPSEC